MSKEKRRVPKLRFPGFTEDWEQCKLSDITEVIMGQSPSSKNYTDNPNDDILVQGNADLKDGKVVPRLWTKEITKTIDKGGIILTVRAPVGDVAKTDYKVVLGRGVAGIKGNDYIYQFLQKLQYNRYWVSLSSGSTFESINSNDIKDLIIDIPSIEEQTKISMLLNNVNSIITLHQRKLDNLKLKKKALLQKLFPKNGEYYPELRFPGFTDAWEQRELAELCNVYDGTHQTPRYTNSGVMFVSVENIKTLESDKYISEDDFKNEFKIFPEFGDILLTRIGDVGSANIILDNIKRAYYVSLALLKPKGVNSLFLLALLSSASVQSEIWKRTLHIAFPKKINKNEISKVIVSKPSILEQKKIGELIYALDQIITLHQRKLDHLQLQKKALLQQMFV